MYPPARAACEPHPALRQDDSRQGRARACPLLRDCRFIVKFITRRTCRHEREKPKASKCFEQWGGRKQRFLRCLSIQVPPWTREKGRGGAYEVILLHKRDNVQRLEVREARSELWEELVRCQRVHNEDRQAPDRRRSTCEYFESAVAMLRKERERDALYWPRRDHLQGSTPITLSETVGHRL